MLRSSRQPSSILPNYGAGGTASATSNCCIGYSNNDIYSKPSFPSSSKRRPSYSSNDFLKNYSSWIAVGLVFFMCLCGHYLSQFQYVLREFDAVSMDDAIYKYRELYTQKAQRQRQSLQIEERYSVLERLNAKLHKEKEDLRSSYEKKMMKEFTSRRQEEDRLVAREEAFKKQIKTLQDSSSREAQRSVKDKFGPGQHYVEFTFVLPSDGDEIEHSFIVETAPVELMPHAVQLFLEQVNHKLWDNSWFYINGPHVLQAGPMLEEDESIEEDTFEADRRRALKPFVDAELASLPFPEYNDQFRHEQWTLGFTGRPGGPDWYINKQNNTLMHGPGGQFHHDIEENADPCFARVIEGQENVERIMKEATIEEGDDWEYFFWDPIYILRAKIISKPHPIVEEMPQQSNHTSEGQHDIHKHHHVDFHKFQKVEHDKA